MVNWSDPEIIGKQAAAFSQLLLVLLGLYTWEVFNSLDFDYSIIANWRDFKYFSCSWKHGSNILQVVYFVCRYSIWVGVTMLIVANNFTQELDCQGECRSQWSVVDILIDLGLPPPNHSVLYNNPAVWQHCDRNCFRSSHASRLTEVLGVISVRSVWDPRTSVCVVTGTSTTLLRLIYGYTMAFDLTVLVVSTAGLLRSGGWQGSDLWKLLFRDGIVYFVVAFVGNSIAAVFTILHLNAAMDIMFTVPAAVFSTVVACRAVRRLSEWARQDVYIQSVFDRCQCKQARAPKARCADHNGDLHGVCEPFISAVKNLELTNDTSQREDDFYHVERPGARSAIARVDLEAPDHSDDEGTTHKSMSQKDLTSPF
ncbi:hypothetical protein AG1IA_02810 [Rhizoctonia solani AG-1 IA]|uniref:Transmembrane protein n=1 Tax=Thanatephorus cucumeris (strain AG1-IA) TaxID=983506 RepID=L8WYW0_THACA|nr:hypothetical protein AG1IA_02810 [Rhizoctonia solani AG-1 IA]